MPHNKNTPTQPVRKAAKTKRPSKRANTKPTPEEQPSKPLYQDDSVSKDGLIRVDNQERLDSIPIYYFAERGRWYGPSGQRTFIPFSDGIAKSYIAKYGFSKAVKDQHGNSIAETAMLCLMQQRSVAYAGPLSGYHAGPRNVVGGRVLVTESTKIVPAEKGDWSTIQAFIESLLADPDHDQVSTIYTWLSQSYKSLVEQLGSRDSNRFRHCPALGIFGPKHCGKSALIDLILAPLFGGRKADPSGFLKEPKFNKDLIAAPLLVLDDTGGSSTLKDRRERGEGIKNLIWKPEQRMEGKGVDAVMLTPFWRMIIASNDDEAGLHLCPALSASLEDKILILRAQMAEGLPTTNEENDEWAAKLRSELPAFADFLLKFKAPKSLELDPRTRVPKFWHPELVSSIRQMQPEMVLLEHIDQSNIFEDMPYLFKGSATDLEKQLRSSDNNRSLDKILTSSNAAGRHLSELCQTMPTRFTKKNWHGTSHYTILPPKEWRPKCESAGVAKDEVDNVVRMK